MNVMIPVGFEPTTFRLTSWDRIPARKIFLWQKKGLIHSFKGKGGRVEPIRASGKYYKEMFVRSKKP